MRSSFVLFFVVAFFTLSPVSAQSSSAFGSQVEPGAEDVFYAIRDAGAPAICRIDFADPGSFVDDGYYADWDADGVIETGDLRLAATASAPAGSAVAEGDGAELRAASDCDTTPSFGFADGNGDGHYGIGDSVYVTSGAAFDVVAPDATSAPDAWTVRLAPFSAWAAGALVRTGDDDFTIFRDQNAPLAAAEFVFSDVDQTGAASPGDWFWLSPSAVNTGDRVPPGSVRLRAVPPASASPSASSPISESLSSAPRPPDVSSSPTEGAESPGPPRSTAPVPAGGTVLLALIALLGILAVRIRRA